jgi:predicted SAM-dependent methyltransferase
MTTLADLIASEDDEVLLNVGCGALPRSGHINIDIMHSQGVDLTGDIFQMEASSCSVDGIICSHFIEHLTKPELKKFIELCHRWLKPDGYLRIIAPDMLAAIERFRSGSTNAEWLENFLFARHLHNQDYHKQGIYREKIQKMLHEAKFRNVVTVQCSGNDPEIKITGMK